MKPNEELSLSKINAMITSGNYGNRNQCIEMAEKIRVHADGRLPEKIILERRPNESEAIKKYRAKIYEPITKTTVGKVFTSLEKIRRSPDWDIRYNTEVPKRITESETLHNYCELNYPLHTSLTNWAFSVLLRRYLIDANGIVAIIPQSIPESNTEYVKPVAEFFDSDQVVDYAEGEYVVLRSRDTSTYTSHNGTRVNTQGAIYYIITCNEFVRYEQINSKQLSAVATYRHNIGRLPAFKAGGVFYARKNNDTIYESRIAAMVPSLDEAVREYSDLQAEILQHIHSEKYAFANAECPECNGTGRVFKKDENGNDIGHEVCKRCNGSGSVLNVSPYGMFTITPAKFGESAIPTPPMGYVQKSTEIAKFSDEHVRQHKYDALAAINMEFLAETPLSQSGVAKQYDKDELNNFVNAIAEDIVRILDSVYYFINEYRYKIIVPNDELRRAMVPAINVPATFDIITASAILQNVKTAREAQLNPAIMRELEVEYAKKQFNTNQDIAKTMTAIYDLDPLYGLTEDTKMTMKANGGITAEDYIISCNIIQFVRRATRENKEFLRNTYDQQMAVMRKYAEEVSKKNDVQVTIPMGD